MWHCWSSFRIRTIKLALKVALDKRRFFPLCLNLRWGRSMLLPMSIVQDSSNSFLVSCEFRFADKAMMTSTNECVLEIYVYLNWASSFNTLVLFYLIGKMKNNVKCNFQVLSVLKWDTVLCLLAWFRFIIDLLETQSFVSQYCWK